MRKNPDPLSSHGPAQGRSCCQPASPSGVDWAQSPDPEGVAGPSLFTPGAGTGCLQGPWQERLMCKCRSERIGVQSDAKNAVTALGVPNPLGSTPLPHAMLSASLFSPN